jgi:hypothetical protein
MQHPQSTQMYVYLPSTLDLLHLCPFTKGTINTYNSSSPQNARLKTFNLAVAATITAATVVYGALLAENRSSKAMEHWVAKFRM